LSERDGYEHGVPCWVDTGQPDPEAAVGFYRGLFGWELEDRMPADSPGHYFVAQVRGRDVAAIGSLPEGAPPTPVWNTYVWVDSADDTAAKAKDAGATALIEPFEVLESGRMALLADPAGAPFCVWEPKRFRGAQRVSEPGAWSMSLLQTPDPEGATAFYGAVFGWTTESFDAGEGEITLWRVPGYEGGEPEQPVSREVVAGVVPLGGPEDAPPHWSVDFWVDDADAAAERAAELGGKALMAPYDVPGFRQAVLADPRGATFTVSQLRAGH
jgi:uncharacterized protein